MTTGLEGPGYLQYKKDHEIVKSNEFIDWILSLKPKDVRGKGISGRNLRNFKQKVKNGKGMKNKSKIARILFEYYKSKSTAQ